MIFDTYAKMFLIRYIFFPYFEFLILILIIPIIVSFLSIQILTLKQMEYAYTTELGVEYTHKSFKTISLFDVL